MLGLDMPTLYIEAVNGFQEALFSREIIGLLVAFRTCDMSLQSLQLLIELNSSTYISLSGKARKSFLNYKFNVANLKHEINQEYQGYLAG